MTAKSYMYRNAVTILLVFYASSTDQRKSKRWWCCILHELHFCVVFTLRSNWQYQTVKWVLILQLSCI